MRTKILLGLAVTSALATIGIAVADDINRASATAVASVSIQPAITLAESQGLDFGVITSGMAGKVAVDPASGGRAVSGGVGGVVDSAAEPGVFTVNGQPNAAIDVVVGATITGFSGGITGVTVVPRLPSALSGASTSFTVGGSLDIPAHTLAGAYTGAYTVAVNYP